jgi:zona occludens toxin (predicted ATPase)
MNSLVCGDTGSVLTLPNVSKSAYSLRLAIVTAVRLSCQAALGLRAVTSCRTFSEFVTTRPAAAVTTRRSVG